MAEDRGRLEKAAEKAVQEITFADAAVSAGCEPAEAMATRVGSGPEDFAGEYVDLNRKHLGDRDNSPEVISFQLDADSPLLRCRVSNNGRFLIPLVNEVIPTVGIANEKPDLKSSDKEERRRRRDLATKPADYASKFIEMLKPASHVQTEIRYPPSSIFRIAETIFYQDMAALVPSVIQLGVICFIKRHYKK
ncbi:hypothetical protein JQ615_41435 [Bradyrhizobium jicamae]|uniref:Uncharacterized protein n=1 Tax=Bradyrhizobium jicamae TaxID=280332 RepID=A0ABS5FYB2_9BRAD|nr:hypothetical protein [Bradyrhizobium jicamae]MBR0801800.1 hypothetical protein [Bradyrhizobium jicamae]